MKFFQYWNADPPAEIGALMDGARDAAPGFDYVRLDEAGARAFVAREQGERMLAAWDALALPAMQADLLRLLLLERHGGVYADATVAFQRPLAAFVARSAHGQMPALSVLANNCYVMVHAPGDAFLRACIAFVLDTIEARRGGSALMATGPGPIDAVRCVLMPAERPLIDAVASSLEDWSAWGWAECLAAADRLVEPTAERIAACRAFDLLPGPRFEEWAISRPAAHRAAGDHWRDHVGRIYRDAAR